MCDKDPLHMIWSNIINEFLFTNACKQIGPKSDCSIYMEQSDLGTHGL